MNYKSGGPPLVRSRTPVLEKQAFLKPVKVSYFRVSDAFGGARQVSVAVSSADVAPAAG